MPWHSGSWGPEEQIRSKRRLDYFQKYNKKKYELNREEIIAKATQYYNLNREAISAKQAINYQKNREEIIAKATQYYNLNREAISAKQAINYQKKKLKK